MPLYPAILVDSVWAFSSLFSCVMGIGISYIYSSGIVVMSYSKEGIRELCLDVDRILIDGDKYNNKVISIEDLQNRLRRKAKFKEIDFQSKCEGDNSLGDLLLKHATENNNPRVKDFLLQNGYEPLQQEQITAAINKEEEAPNVEENRADSNEVDSSNSINPGMTAEVLYGQLIQGKETNSAIFDSFANAVRESNITGDRGVFLDVVKLFTDLDPVIHLTDTASRTILGIAAITKQADVVKVLLGSGKFNEEEKFNALRSAIVQGNVQEVGAFLGHIKYECALEALDTQKTKVLRNGKEKVEDMKEAFNALKTAILQKEQIEDMMKALNTLKATVLCEKKEQIEDIKPPNMLRTKVNYEQERQIKDMIKILNTLKTATLQKEQIEDMIKTLNTLETKVLSEEQIEGMKEALNTLKTIVLHIENMVKTLNTLETKVLQKEQIEGMKEAFNTLKTEVLQKEQIRSIKEALNALETKVLQKEQIESIMKAEFPSKKQIEDIIRTLNTLETKVLQKEQIEGMKEALNTLKTEVLQKEQIEVMREFFLCNKNLTEEEKIQDLSNAVMNYNVPQVKLLLEHMVGIPEASKKNLLEIMEQRQPSLKKEDNTSYPKTNAIIVLLKSAIKNGEKEKQSISNVEENGNRAGPSSNGNVDSRPVNTPNGQLNHNNEDETPVVTAPTILTKETNTNHTITPNSGNGQHHNNEDETPVVTAPTILTKETNTNQTVTPNSGNGQHHNNKNKTPVSTRTDQTATPNNDNKTNGFVDAQFSRPNTQETKYKESKENFYTSLTKDVVGVVVTGLFIAAAVMVPSVAGAVVCGVIAALVATYIGLHVKNSTLPSYREMEKNKVEHVSPKVVKI